MTASAAKWLRLARRLRSRHRKAVSGDDWSVVLFPGAARRASGADAWEIQACGWVFEFRKRPALVRLLRRVLRNEWSRLTEAEKVLCAERARYFLASAKPGRDLVASAGTVAERLGRSRSNGYFQGTIRVEIGDDLNPPVEPARTRWLRFEAWDAANVDRRFEGSACLPSDEGLSIVSDIDDTIKVTGVGDRTETLLNTFCRPFKPAPGMAKLYQSWNRGAGTVFHYVSASPWQLYPIFGQFLRENGFPEGTFHLRRLALKDGSFLRLLAPPVRHKRMAVESLLRLYPSRRFVLVGDSGERDPEIYGSLARNWPDRIASILIREVGPGEKETGRYAAAFRELPRKRWRVFREPSELGEFTPD